MEHMSSFFAVKDRRPHSLLRQMLFFFNLPLHPRNCEAFEVEAIGRPRFNVNDMHGKEKTEPSSFITYQTWKMKRGKKTIICSLILITPKCGNDSLPAHTLLSVITSDSGCFLLRRLLMRWWDVFPKLPRRRCWQRWTPAPEPSSPGPRPPSSAASRSSCATSSSSRTTL